MMLCSLKFNIKITIYSYIKCIIFHHVICNEYCPILIESILVVYISVLHDHPQWAS